MPTNKDKLSLYICIYINRIYPVNAIVVVKLFSSFLTKLQCKLNPSASVHAFIKDRLYIGRITSSCHAHRNSQGSLEEAAVYKKISQAQLVPTKNKQKIIPGYTYSDILEHLSIQMAPIIQVTETLLRRDRCGTKCDSFVSNSNE